MTERALLFWIGLVGIFLANPALADGRDCATSRRDCAERGSRPRKEQPQLGVRSAPVIRVDGLTFKDLNRDGKLQPYEDWRLTPQARAADLVGRMTLEEKAGTMMHGTAPSLNLTGSGKSYDLTAATKLIDGQRVTSFITRLSGTGAEIAAENNKLQAVAEQARLGVPLTISTDPRNHFQHTVGAGVAAGGFSKWPESLGFAAIGDEVLMRRFGEVARQEYRATGIHMALSPQADLATEPRWPRITGTFGEDADLASRMVRAYVAGFQAGEGGLTKDSVITVVKHWVGYGAAKDGWDSHNSYGRYATFPTGNFAYHIKPFEGAFAAKVASVMPTYSILQGLTLDGKPVEQVAAGFNKYLLTDLLRGRYGFDGVILSDWGITNDCPAFCRGEGKFELPLVIGQPWGVDDLTETQRFAKALAAGIDQFGGTEQSQRLVEIVKSGQAKESRLDESVRRILIQKFELGLFENPYVDPDVAARIVGSKAFQAEGDAAQARCMVMLERKDGVLPLTAGRKVYLRGLDAAAATARGLVVVDSPEKADLAIIRTGTPHQLVHSKFLFGRMQNEGDLDFKDGNPDYEAIKQASAKVPTIVVIFLDRPAILTNVKDRASALIGDFGASDSVVLKVLAGEAKAEGRLPFELPSSMAAVRAQASDRPYDSEKPLYSFGYALGR
jgi:beta-glucosidase